MDKPEMADLERLWAPWRNAFLTQAASSKKTTRCIFCAAKRAAAADDRGGHRGVSRGRRRESRTAQPEARRHYVVARGRRAFAILNLYPYNNGHVMVAPSRHTGELERLTPAEWTEMLRIAQRLMRRLRATLRPHGFNIGMNLGRVAGAGIPGHLHLHIVPRWNGDTNFMPITGRTKVMSQALDELYQVLTTEPQRNDHRNTENG